MVLYTVLLTEVARGRYVATVVDRHHLRVESDIRMVDGRMRLVIGRAVHGGDVQAFNLRYVDSSGAVVMASVVGGSTVEVDGTTLVLSSSPTRCAWDYAAWLEVQAARLPGDRALAVLAAEHVPMTTGKCEACYTLAPCRVQVHLVAYYLDRYRGLR